MGVLTEPPGLPTWSDYPRFLKRHRALVGALIGLGLLGGFAWSLLSPPTFSATASIALAPVPVYVTASTTELVPPEVSIDTDAQLLHSPQVLGAVADALGTDAGLASEQLSVTASPNSHVIHVTVTAASAQLAARAADAAGAAFVDVRRDTLGALREDQLRQLRMVIRDQEQLLAQEQTSRLVTSSYEDPFAQILQLRASLDELEEARTQPAEVVRPAVPPASPDHANTEVPVTSGAMVGLLAGCLLGAARDRVPRRPHQPLSPGTHPRAPGDLPDTTTRHEDYHHAV
jgi:uncharacterized protein involved in exopolysaccharide biosynthesis